MPQSAQFANISNVKVAQCAIIMVGLPARGKTYISKKLTRYLNWIGVDTTVFNVGEYRRRAAANLKSTSDFFDPQNVDAVQIRDNCAIEALNDMVNWLKSGGEVAVYDATNTNRKRREMLYQHLFIEHGIRTFFVESICFDQDIINANIKEVKVSSPDYINTEKDSAIEDFKKRIEFYESQYETLDEILDGHLSFIKIINQGERFLVNQIFGHVESRVVFFLMNINILPRTIYITRHGETEMNVKGIIQNNCKLSERGVKFAEALANFVKEMKIKSGFQVWTSLMTETKQTASNIKATIENWKALNEVDAGVCEGLTYSQIEAQYPDIFKMRNEDKFNYRYPGGESYQDLVSRLEPVIMELERQEDVLVICSQAVCRCLLAFFLNKDHDELPYLDIPLHTIFKLTPVAYGCKEERIVLPIPAVSTYRPKTIESVQLTLAQKRARRRLNSECKEEECCGRRRNTCSVSAIH